MSTDPTAEHIDAADCDNTTHVCSCWPDERGHADDCNSRLSGPSVTAHEPLAEHRDAVARVIDPAAFDVDSIDWLQRAVIEGPAHDLLTSTDPAVHAALAASLPAEVMLAALVDGGYCLVCGGMNGAHHAADDGLPCPEDPDAVLDEVAP